MPHRKTCQFKSESISIQIFFTRISLEKEINAPVKCEIEFKMSLIPYILDDYLPLKRYNSIVGSFPGHLTLTPRELKLIQSLIPIGQLRRSADLYRSIPNSHIGKDGFEVHLNVEKFKPEEVTVKTVDDSIIIEAKSERKSENEFVSSHYRRRYELPDGFRPNDVISTMSSDGVLTVRCPRTPVDKNSVRQIEIKQTGTARQIEEGDTPPKQENEKTDRCRVF